MHQSSRRRACLQSGVRACSLARACMEREPGSGLMGSLNSNHNIGQRETRPAQESQSQSQSDLERGARAPDRSVFVVRECSRPRLTCIMHLASVRACITHQCIRPVRRDLQAETRSASSGDRPVLPVSGDRGERRCGGLLQALGVLLASG